MRKTVRHWCCVRGVPVMGVLRLKLLIGDDVVARDVIDLRRDAERDRLATAVHAAVPALAMLSIQRELLKINRDDLPERPADDASADEPWPEPEPIERPKVPRFPVEVLPEPLRAWAAATAEACQVPSDLPGLLALAVCSGVAARRIAIVAGRGWCEPINLYTACLLEPANRKSAVFSAACPIAIYRG
ncbi:MAG: DUF3987 domain-containing protein [Pirellulaceae bacterium]